MELITLKGCNDGFINDLIKEMNEHRIEGNCETYMYNPQRSSKYPGAMIGHIVVDDNNVIQEIKLYDNAESVGCYKKSVREAIKKFIGYKIIFN